MLIVAGNQVPVIPLGEVVPSVGATSPAQNGAMAAKSGVILGLTVTLRVCVVAHCPAAGVNTYEPEVVLLMVAGNQVPVIPLGEVVPSVGATSPAQKGAMAAKSGVTFGVTVTFRVCVVAHCPAAGVNT